MCNKGIEIKRQERNPEKFDILDLFDGIGRNKQYILGDEKSEGDFLDLVRKSLLLNNTPTMIHGKRIEALFAYMLSSLGKCSLIKKEDSGDVFSNENIKIPDYRVVINNVEKKQILVEVKNYYQEKVSKNYSLNIEYLDSLSRYSSIVDTELLIAIYWTKLCSWTLVSPEGFKRDGTKATISFNTAMKRNQMVYLGDVMIGTTPPLTIRIYPDEKQLNSFKKNIANFTVGKVELLSNGVPILAENEQKIAYNLILFANWQEQSSVRKSPHSQNQVDYIEFAYYPQKHGGESLDLECEKYDIVGMLSTIISRQYGELTTTDGKVDRISPDISPKKLGFIIPDNYKGTSLPLWRFYIKPNDDLE